MKRPGFFTGVAVAFVACVLAGVSYTTLSLLFGGPAALRLVIGGLGLGYTLYLLGRSGERVGRISTIVLWLAAAAALWLLQPSLLAYLTAHLGVLWLVRSLYFHSSLLAALADLGLVAFGLGAAVWAATQSGSVFLSVWCFFLVQALFGLIPPRLAPRASDHSAGNTGEQDRFALAHRTAEAAVRKLSSIR